MSLHPDIKAVLDGESEGAIVVGDAFDVLQSMPPDSVQCCVTSPPYWGLRDYGVDGQLGLEKTPEEYVEKMVILFRELRRVLRDDGTLWLNMGDSYGAVGGDTHSDFNKRWTGTGGEGSKQNSMLDGVKDRQATTGLRPKNLLGIPWRVAFALQADGWYLRQDIIWHKPNPMPESVRDRCTKAHEYIFLMSKKPRYYYDAEAVKEKTDPVNWRYGSGERKYESGGTGLSPRTGLQPVQRVSRNKRSVWTVTTKPFSKSHFATFPPDLIKPCILAGCPTGGVVLDPFFGAGTTGVVSRELGRRHIGIELNPEYAEMARVRIRNTDKSLFAGAPHED